MVDYDLKAPGKDYTSLINAIQQFHCLHTLRSSWLVKAAVTAEELRNYLFAHMDSNDGIIVADVTGRALAWQGLGEGATEWIQANIKG